MCLFTQTHHPPKRWLDHIEIQSFQTQWMMFSCLTNKNTCSHHPPGWSSFSSPWNLASEPWPCGEATGYVYIVYVDLQCSVYISLTANYLHILNLHKFTHCIFTHVNICLHNELVSQSSAINTLQTVIWDWGTLQAMRPFMKIQVATAGVFCCRLQYCPARL